MPQPIPLPLHAFSRPEHGPDAPGISAERLAEIEAEARATTERRRWRSRAAWTPPSHRGGAAWK